MTTEETMTTAAENRAVVERAFGALVATGDMDTLARVLDDDFVHHRPDATSSSKEEWLTAVRDALGQLAGMQVEILHVLADGDLVAMHSRRRLPSGGPEITVVDIWRFDAGVIVEGWETIEPAAEASAHLEWWELPRDHLASVR